ncbi:MAG: DUF4338 domain-containing protein [Candidatus Riflebacteria bacterium]|nr:DUF4338 domain-containing protein [Candidatus Riflebacteria bacterium]
MLNSYNILSENNINFIKGLVNSGSSASIRSIALEICNFLQLKSLNGKPKIMTALKVMKKLEKQGIINLPAQKVVRRPNSEKLPAKPTFYPLIQCDISELGQLEVIVIEDINDSNGITWKNLIEDFHYLGNTSFFGAQIKYLIKSPLFGPVAALGFSAAAWSIKKKR